MRPCFSIFQNTLASMRISTLLETLNESSANNTLDRICQFNIENEYVSKDSFIFGTTKYSNSDEKSLNCEPIITLHRLFNTELESLIPLTQI